MKLALDRDCGEGDLPDSDDSSEISSDAQNDLSDVSSISEASSTNDFHSQLPQDGTTLSVDDLRSVIDGVIASPSQTYQQFLESFMYLLTHDDDNLQQTAVDSFGQLSGQSTESMSIPEAASDVFSVQESLLLGESATLAEDQIEELVLSSVACCDRPQSRPRIHLQVDNFVPNDEEDELTDSSSLNSSLGFILPSYSADSASFRRQGHLYGETVSHDTFENCNSLTRDERLESTEMVAVLPDMIVEPFVLDADFDYDSVSVALTPKYSFQELESILASDASPPGSPRETVS